mgnify:CR=1 FL=1
MSDIIDVAVIGAGVAGLTCSQILQQAGYQVLVLEKSRGVGGRLATRRAHETRIDHGTCYLSPKDELFKAFIAHLLERDIVQCWTDQIFAVASDGSFRTVGERSPRYVAADGMSAIAKALTPGLTIHFNQRVVRLELASRGVWQLIVEVPDETGRSTQSRLEAKAILITTPAPQAVDLLAPLESRPIAPSVLTSLRTVEFSPCITVMAGYENVELGAHPLAQMKAIAPVHPAISWIGLDSSKRRAPTIPAIVVQSTASFAQTHPDTPALEAVGQTLLDFAAALTEAWLAAPTWKQVHRWRYAIATHPLPSKYLIANTEVPLLCAGDWCGGNRVESAFLSGLEAADGLNQLMQQRELPPLKFWQAMP